MTFLVAIIALALLPQALRVVGSITAGWDFEHIIGGIVFWSLIAVILISNV
jgi:hypothetical protein